jgi:hypothetical protein
VKAKRLFVVMLMVSATAIVTGCATVDPTATHVRLCPECKTAFNSALPRHSPPLSGPFPASYEMGSNCPRCPGGFSDGKFQSKCSICQQQAYGCQGHGPRT